MGRNFNKYFLTIMCFVFLGYLINAYISDRDKKAISEEEMVGKCTKDYFEVNNVQWPKDGQNAVEIINAITITNRGDYDCKDIRGCIIFFSKDGTELGKGYFVLDGNIGSKKTKIYKNIPFTPVFSSTVYRTLVSVEGTAVLSPKEE